MAVLALFSVRDRVAGIYGSPFVSTNHATAIRMFRAECAMTPPRGAMQTNPEDFELYYLGEFNDDYGRFEPLQAPEFVQRGVAVSE